MSVQQGKMNVSEFQFNYIQKKPSESTGTLLLDSEAEPTCPLILSILLGSHLLHNFLGKAVKQNMS